MIEMCYHEDMKHTKFFSSFFPFFVVIFEEFTPAVSTTMNENIYPQCKRSCADYRRFPTSPLRLRAAALNYFRRRNR